MANASVICTDKTGTLTQNEMTVVAGSVGIHAKFVARLDENHQRTNADESAQSSGDRRHPKDFSVDQTQLGDCLSPALIELFNEAVAVNSTAFEDVDPKDPSKTILVGSKTETALLKFTGELGWTSFKTLRDKAQIVQMIPFSSERKAMGVVVKLSSGGYRVYLKGASEILTKKCVDHVVVHKPGTTSGTDGIRTEIIDEHANDNISRTIIFYANQTLRTIAICYKDLDSWPPKGSHPDEQGEVRFFFSLLLFDVAANDKT
jgi:Ca2+-transporting ATPase